MQQATTVTKAPARAVVASYVNLIKPHVTVLLLGTALAAMAVASNGHLPFVATIATMVGGAMAAGSANAINCYWDRDIDQLMSRTRTRSLPSGRVQETHALVFGLTLGVLSVLTYSLFVNLLSATLALTAIVFYVVIYTMWLKRSTPQNLVIGGAAGAVPVLIGWAAVTNSLSWAAVWMFLIIFFWTPPHFWAVSLVLKNDYARAGVPMLPVVKGERETHRQIVLYTVVLIAVSLGLFAGHYMGWLYLISALTLGVVLIVYALHLARARTLKSARTLFWMSNNYLALLFAAMVLDRIFH